MTYISTQAGAQPTRTFLSAVVAHLKARAKHRRDRKTYIRMLQLDNHALADIGLTREDIREQLALPTQSMSD